MVLLVVLEVSTAFSAINHGIHLGHLSEMGLGILCFAAVPVVPEGANSESGGLRFLFYIPHRLIYTLGEVSQ